MEIKEQLVKEKEVIEKSIETLDSKIKDLEKKEEKNGEEWEKAVEETKRKLEELSKPFRDKRNSISKQKSETQNKVYDLKNQLGKIGEKIKYQKAIINKEYDSESFEARLKFLSERLSYGVEISEKKKLPNGIQVFRIFDESNYTEWFAFYGLKCVGFSYRRAGQHAGDSTYPYSYIGNIKKELKVKGKYGNPINATFTEWKKSIEQKDPTKLKEIDLENEETQSIVIKHKGLSW